MKRSPHHQHTLFDVLYGFIPLTDWEEKIINSPYFQRLRWIKQLGFANYIFPGAEHNRFAHVIGVMHSMDQMIRALGLAVPDHELFDRKVTHAAALFHKSMRIAALLHDIGTFPFSHAIEFAYLRHGNHPRRSDAPLSDHPPKDLPNSHEHLGSFLIKNTRFPGGLTQILEDYGFDVQMISKIIKGEAPQLIANQLMHSDLDADRMDYLIRDAHFTGLKYGQFDRDYLLANLTCCEAGPDQLAFGVRENALHAVEDFLIARFSWYSQIIKNPGSAKFDILASHLAQNLLEEDRIHQFHDLLTMIEERDERFFWWNDLYFMNRCQQIRQELLTAERAHPPSKLAELTEMLLYRKPPKTIRHPLFKPRILSSAQHNEQKTKLTHELKEQIAEFEAALKKYGTGQEWLMADLPEKDVIFTQGLDQVKKNPTRILARDPVKIIAASGQPSLLVELDNSLMKHLSGFISFAPSVWGNESALQLLKDKKLIPETDPI